MNHNELDKRPSSKEGHVYMVELEAIPLWPFSRELFFKYSIFLIWRVMKSEYFATN